MNDATYPCRPGTIAIDSAAGHADLVSALADAGFIVLSINAGAAFPMDNALPYGDGFESSTTGAFDVRAQLVDLHLAALAVANVGGPNAFGPPLAGRADLSRVGLVGHSRGGQGMVEAALRSHVDFTVRGLFLIAPTNFYDQTPPDLPLHVLLGSCDGDVWNLSGAASYDAARGGRTTPISQTLVVGANHNWHSTAWGPATRWGFDDAPTSSSCRAGQVGRLRPTSARQRLVLRTLAKAFFRRHLGGAPPSAVLGETWLDSSVVGVATVPSYEGSAVDRLDIDRPAQRSLTALGTAVRGRGLALGYRTLAPPSLGAAPPAPWSPHRLSLRTVRWNAPGGSVSYPLASFDASSYDAVSFRIAADTWVRRGAVSFNVVLRDTDGGRRSVRVRIPAQLPNAGAYRKAVLGTVRIPLSRFGGVDLASLRVLELRAVGPRGAALLADVAFVRLP